MTINLPVLNNGDSGSMISFLQQLLLSQGFGEGMQNQLRIDGIFGETTLHYVKAFQQAKKLDVDGVVGQQTWQALSLF